MINALKKKNLVIGDLNVGFYAGVPLNDSTTATPIGTLCVLDTKPKTLSTEQKRALKALAKEVMNRLESHKNNIELKEAIDKKKQELTESTKRYYTLYHDAPDMMASVSPKTRKIVACNNTLCSKLEYDQLEILDKDLFNLYHPDCHEKVEKAFQKFVETGVVKNEKLILRKKNGEKILVTLSVKAVKDDDGNITHSNSIWRDISDLADAEEMLKEANHLLEEEVELRTQELEFHKERLELALEGTNDGIWDRVNLKADEEWWSPSFHQLLGYKEGEIEQSYSSFVKNLLHPDELEMIDKAMGHCIENKAPMDLEHRLRLKGGTYKWFRAKANAMRDEEGNPIRLTGSISDIHQQKLLELKLSETEKFLTKVTEIAPSIIYVFNQETMSNEYTNREIGEVLGYSISEVREMGEQLIPTLCHPDDLNTVFQHFGKIQQLGEKETITVEYRMKHKTEGYRWLLSEDTVFERNLKGEVAKHIGVATDITTFKNNEEELINQSNILERQNEDLKQLAYIATHDLKSPMVSIEGHFDYLKNQFENKSEYVLESIDFIETGINQFHTTLSGLSEAIKIKEVEIESEPINLSEKIQDESLNYEPQINKLGGTLHLEVQKGLVVNGTSLYLNSILQNLISNSIKYRSSERNLKIDICLKREDNYIYLSITDNGLGIDLSLHKERLFKMFNRFHDHIQGNGMGLYMVKTMVEKLNGSIEMESEENVGTVFVIKFKYKK